MIDTIKQAIPEVLKDLRINLGKVLDLSQMDGLTEKQIIGSALAVAFQLANQPLISMLTEQAQDEALIQAAELAAGLMAMTNIYYRFAHFTEDAEVEHLPAGLRMQGMMNPGVDRVIFEVMSLAVSALNGCGVCISAHTKQLKEHGVTAVAIARVGKIAAVIHAVHISLGIEGVKG